MNGIDGSVEVVTFGEAMGMFVATTPGPLHRVRGYQLAQAGAEANVATGLARLGHRVGWVGQVGDDPLGRFVVDELAAEGVDVSHVGVDGAAPTGFQLKSMAQGRDPEVVYFRGNSAGSRLVASTASDSYLAGARHLHVTSIPSPCRRRAASSHSTPSRWPVPQGRACRSSLACARTCGPSLPR